MGFGLSFKIAPGVRVRASTRGVSAGIGPRVARAHVGTRGVGVSSGVGPVSVYGGVGGGRRRSSGSSSSGYSVAAYEREARRAQREQEVDSWLELNREMVALGSVHEREFAAARKPIAASPPAVDRAAIVTEHERSAIDGISWFRRAERTIAKEQSHAAAERQFAEEEQRRAAGAKAEQVLLDEAWQELLDNDSRRVLTTLEEAFADNEAPAAAVDCEKGGVTLLMRLAPLEVLVPERMVAQTPTGRITTKKRSKTERNALFVELMASNALATVKEAFAVAPGLAEARIAVIRDDESAGGHTLTPLYTGIFRRDDLASVRWADVHTVRLIEAADGLLNLKGRTGELVALDLGDEPDVHAFLAEVAQQLGWSLAQPSPPRKSPAVAARRAPITDRPVEPAARSDASETSSATAGALRPGQWATLRDEGCGAALAVSVGGFDDSADPNDEYDRPASGKRLVATTVRVRNVGPNWYRGNLGYHAELLDDSHHAHEPESFGAGGQALGDLRLRPGSERVGTLTFTLPKRRQPIELQLRAGYDSDLGEWELSASPVSEAGPDLPDAGPVPRIGEALALPGPNEASQQVTALALVDPAEPADDYDRPLAGRRLIGVEVLVRNLGGSVVTDYASFGALLIDDANEQYEPVTADLAVGPELNELRLRPGGQRAGFIAFSIPLSRAPRVFQLTMDGGQAASSGEWRL